jgi:hypothetical protein
MAHPFGHDAPRLSWLNGKTYPQQGDSRKNRSKHGSEETEARVENALGVLARQELKDRVDAMRPKIAETPISVTENLDFQPSPPSPEDISISELANELL